MKKILTIAGSDPSGGAGVQKDLAVFSELGAYGLSAVTAVTSQNTRGVQDAFILEPDVVLTQLASVYSDLTPDAVKTGCPDPKVMLRSGTDGKALIFILWLRISYKVAYCDLYESVGHLVSAGC